MYACSIILVLHANVQFYTYNMSTHACFMQVLSFLRCDHSVSAGAGDPKPCISFVLSKLLRELKEDGINCSRLAIHLFLKKNVVGITAYPLPNHLSLRAVTAHLSHPSVAS